MNADADFRKLREEFSGLAADGDGALKRYELSKPPVPPGWYWKVRWTVGWLLRFLESLHLKSADPWPARLRSKAGSAKARPLVIWAMDTNHRTFRESCTAIESALQQFPAFAPVLITNSLDFAFMSRLGWLVEYVPALDGAGVTYDKSKLRLLARLYRGAPVMPLAAGSNPAERIRLAIDGGPDS